MLAEAKAEADVTAAPFRKQSVDSEVRKLRATGLDERERQTSGPQGRLCGPSFVSLTALNDGQGQSDQRC
jgi:hypothetical protein